MCQGKKFEFNQKSVKDFPLYLCLTSKTQMIRNKPSDNSFLNMFAHTKHVKNTALMISDKHNLTSKGVDRERLICPAFLHDVWYTPYGHAGEEIM